MADILENKLMTIEQVAEYASVSVRYLHDEKKRGNIKCFKIGRKLMFEPEDVKKWIKRKIAS